MLYEAMHELKCHLFVRDKMSNAWQSFKTEIRSNNNFALQITLHTKQRLCIANTHKKMPSGMQSCFCFRKTQMKHATQHLCSCKTLNCALKTVFMCVCLQYTSIAMSLQEHSDVLRVKLFAMWLWQMMCLNRFAKVTIKFLQECKQRYLKSCKEFS